MMTFLRLLAPALFALIGLGVETAAPPVQLSGIYPHLAFYNDEGECGTGAVVPWAGRLWVVTYGPHLPFGSSDKLYEIGPDLRPVVRPESIGGTPANRMIHRESRQLFIGPYAIDASGTVRTIPYDRMPGRPTGNARHLTDPAGRIYYGTMEEGFYEVDVKTLAPRVIHEDGNRRAPKGADTAANPPAQLLPGAHGKGLYSGQGVLVYSNNGEPGEEALKRFDIDSGSLSEWDGRKWTLVRRSQFTEVTGPGGIAGNPDPAADPLWTIGWDHKSLLLGTRWKGGWSFYRLPKASHSYDGAHGWNTEWPRIRDVGAPGNPDYLMTMHGLFWRFPAAFRPGNTAGLRPRSAYLKVIGDFARWDDRLVFGCDDAANKEFLNARKAKGRLEGPGQSNSNLWFTAPDGPDRLGPATAEGAVWLREKVAAGAVSEPFLFAGWARRCAWIHNEGPASARFRLEIDASGTGRWHTVKTVGAGPGRTVFIEFPPKEPGEWIRAVAETTATGTVHFSYAAADRRGTAPAGIFDGLSKAGERRSTGGLLWGLGNGRRALGMAAQAFDGSGVSEAGYYELDASLRLVRKDDPATRAFIREKLALTGQGVFPEDSSVLVVDDAGRRWRLPLGGPAQAGLMRDGRLRICREAATERDLFNCQGTFYELPAENADGFAKIRPVASHDLRIHDYASYRGLLVMTGIADRGGSANPHIIRSADGKAAVWAGAIDDLWRLGKPVGRGGPWKDSPVRAGVPSDPYLIGFYDRRTLSLSHDSGAAVKFTIEVEPVGHGPWMTYKDVTVGPGERFELRFPDGFQSRWVRFTADRGCKATTWLVYE